MSERGEVNMEKTSLTNKKKLCAVMILLVFVMGMIIDDACAFYAGPNTPEEFALEAKQEYYRQSALNVVNKIAVEANKYKTDREKLAYVYNYLQDNCKYFLFNYHLSDAQKVYDALVLGTTDCTGYAAAVTWICEAIDIPVIRYGKSESIDRDSYHEWNIVYVDGQWFHLDAQGKYFLLKDEEMGKVDKVDKDRIRNEIDNMYPVKINGSPLISSRPMIIINGRALVGLRVIFEALGAKVNWDEATQTVTATKGSDTIVVIIGSTQATVNGATKTLDVPAKIINGRTSVPVRFISESLGARVDWDEASQTVNVITQ